MPFAKGPVGYNGWLVFIALGLLGDITVVNPYRKVCRLLRRI